MDDEKNKIKFTGEFFVPEKSGDRIESDHMERYRFVGKYVKNKTVLDIACGYGYGSQIMMQSGATSYEGVDINEQLVANATSLYGHKNVNYFHGDICSYDPGRSFDIITCFETIEHVINFSSALKILHKLLKSDGKLFISSPNRILTLPGSSTLFDKPPNPYHKQEFIIEELKAELTSAGFLIDPDDIYGQRQRYFHFKHKQMRDLSVKLFGDPDVKTSPVVTKVNTKIPKYFIIIAHK